MSEPAPQHNRTPAITLGQVVGLAIASVLFVLASISIVTPYLPHIGQGRGRALAMALLAVLAIWGTWHRRLWALVAACLVWYFPYPPPPYAGALGTAPILYLLAALLLFVESRAAEGGETATASQPIAAGEDASVADWTPRLTKTELIQFGRVVLSCCLLPIPGGTRTDSFGVFYGGSLGLIVPWLRFEMASMMGVIPLPGGHLTPGSPLGLIVDLALAAVLLGWAARREVAWHLAIASLLLAVVWWPVAVVFPLGLWLPFELICPEGPCAATLPRLALGAYLVGVVLVSAALTHRREPTPEIGDFTGRPGEPSARRESDRIAAQE